MIWPFGRKKRGSLEAERGIAEYQAVDRVIQEAARTQAERFDLTGVPAYNMDRLPASVASLSHITSFKFINTGIMSIAPLANLTGLEVLDLSYSRNLVDIAPLAGLTHLTDLNLFRTKARDLSALSQLTTLKRLNIEGVEATDLSPLSGLTALEHLSLANTQISDVRAIAGLTNLKSLSLWNTGVTDFSPLAGLTQLERLDLWNTRISDVAPLAPLTRLTHLDLSHTDVTDIAPVLDHPDLTTLALWNTPCQAHARGVTFYSGRWYDSDVHGHAAKGDLSALKDSIARGAMISEEQWDGPIHAAIRANQIEVVRFLLSLDPHLANDIAPYDGVYNLESPLSLAIDHRRPDIVALLLDAGAFIGIEDDDPSYWDLDAPHLAGLHMSAAARSDNVGLLRRFLDAGIRHDARDENGLAALHWAVAGDCRNATHVLLNCWREAQNLPQIVVPEMTSDLVTEALDQLGDPKTRFGYAKSWVLEQ